MKRLLAFLCFTLLFIGTADAHQGMITFLTDTISASCSTDIGVGQTGNLYAFYVRGDGPRVGNSFEFRVLKSSPDVILLAPTFNPESPLQNGTIEVDITMSFTFSCLSAGYNYLHLMTLPVMNLADPDTFIVRVANALKAIPTPGVYAVLCNYNYTMYSVAGGCFVVNGDCALPGDPWPVAVQNKSWGAIKNLYR